MKVFILTLLLIGSLRLIAQETIVYKVVGTDSLIMDIYKPEIGAEDKVPAMVFFFGGGWSKWNFDKFRPHAKYFAQRGLLTVLVDYRVAKVHGTSPAAALRDAKSAIRFIRAHADSLGIDPNKIIAAGGSAGGHLAAATAVTVGFNEHTDNTDISCSPDVLVLFNPVIDNGPGGYGYERVKDYYKDFSPLHNLKSGTPSTLIMLGTNDKLIPVETARYYQKMMERLGDTCVLKLYEGQKHGFFNYHHFDNYVKTVKDTDDFLQSLGYLKEDPVIEIK